MILHQMEGLKLAHCIGCFGCWVKTPGECIHKDAGREIARDVITSHTAVLLSPVVFGGYSASLKYMVDRFIPLIHPNMMMLNGETHHRVRYSRYPRIVGLGLQPEYDEVSARVFKILVGRNALNFHCPTYAAEVLHGGEDEDLLSRKLTDLMTREDRVPGKTVLTSMISELTAETVPGFQVAGTKRAFLLIGSPKSGASTSEVLSGYLMARLEEKGWQCQTVKLRPKVLRNEGLTELISQVDQAGLIVMAFPLYVDSLPALVTKALEMIWDARKSLTPSRTRRLFVIVNNGFPEAYQNATALVICRNFAEKTGMVWAGSLALGAGEAVVAGQPLTQKKRSGPPVLHVIEALNQVASLIDQKGQVSQEALKGLEKSPIPMMPFALWRRMFIFLAALGWKKQASQNGIKPLQMNACPYAH